MVAVVHAQLDVVDKRSSAYNAVIIADKAKCDVHSVGQALRYR
jgi:hypothetical protein